MQQTRIKIMTYLMTFYYGLTAVCLSTASVITSHEQHAGRHHHTPASHENAGGRHHTTESIHPPTIRAENSSTDLPKPTMAPSAAAASSTPEPDMSNSVEDQVYDNFTEIWAEHMRIAIKHDILNRLGMTNIPDVSKFNTSVQERRQILRLYKKSMAELHGKKYSSVLFSDDNFYANQFYSFTEHGGHPSSIAYDKWSTLLMPQKQRLFFAIDIPEPTDPRKETIMKSASLKLYKREVKPQNLLVTDIVDNSVRVEIYQIVHPIGSQWLRRSVDSKLISLDKTGWEEFDISRAVQDWIREPASNYGLEIVVDSRYQRMDDVVEFTLWSQAVRDRAHESARLPSLNVLTQEKRILGGRQKRSVIESRADCTPGDNERRCCRYPLTISFKEIGWDSWVIEPASYDAYYCHGSCPAGYRVANRHASIKSIMMNLSPSVIPSLALHCTATRLSPLNIAHYNKEGVLVVSVFENMIPEQCMCT